MPQYQDGNGNIVQPFKDSKLPPLFGPQNRSATAVAAKGCGPGIRIQIPANALVDQSGQAPAGPVQVALSTVDFAGWIGLTIPDDCERLKAWQARVSARPSASA